MTGQDRLDFVLQTLRAHADDYRRMGVAHMAVFGSVARGEAGEESDVDLVIEVAENARLTLFDLMDIQEASEQWVGSPVDVLTSRSLKPRMAAEVTDEAVRVF